MAYSASKNASGLYEVYQDGNRIATGTASILQNYGLSETQLSSSEPAPTAIGTQTSQSTNTPVASTNVNTTPANATPVDATTPPPSATTEALTYITPKPSDGLPYYQLNNPDQYNIPDSTFVTYGGQTYKNEGGRLYPAPGQSVGNYPAITLKSGAAIPTSTNTTPGTAQPVTTQPTAQPTAATGATPSAPSSQTNPITQPTASVTNPITPAQSSASQTTQTNNAGEITATQVAALPNLQPGSTGADVTTLQKFLIQQGYAIPSLQNGSAQYGFYGPETKAAVAAYQQANGINPQGNPGFFGPITKGYLSSLPSSTSTTSTGPEAQYNASSGVVSTSTTTTEDSFLSNVHKILNEYGLKPPAQGTSTQTAFADTYQAIISQMGLTTVKAQYDSTLKKFTDLQNELADKKAQSDDDPWMTQGVKDQRKAELS